MVELNLTELERVGTLFSQLNLKKTTNLPKQALTTLQKTQALDVLRNKFPDIFSGLSQQQLQDNNFLIKFLSNPLNWTKIRDLLLRNLVTNQSKELTSLLEQPVITEAPVEGSATTSAEPASTMQTPAETAISSSGSPLASGVPSMSNQTTFNTPRRVVIQQPPPILGKEGGTGIGTAATNKIRAMQAKAETVPARKLNSSSVKSSVSSTFKRMGGIGSKAGVFFQRNIGKYLTAARVATLASGVIGAITGGALTNSAAGALFGAGLGTLAPTWISSGAGTRFFKRVGNGAINSVVRASNQISAGRVRTAKSFGSKRVAWALLGFLVFFVIAGAALTGFSGSGSPPGSGNPTGSTTCDTSGFDLFDANAVTDDILNKFIEKQKASSVVAKGSEQYNLFDSRAKFIRNTAQAAGLNPALFLGFWRSESAFSNDQYRRGNDLGCRPNSPEITTFEEDVLCAVGTKSAGKTYEPSYTTRCLLSRDANSPACQILKPTADKEGFSLPINSLDSYLKGYGPLSADPNNINTHNTVKQVISEMGLAKCSPSSTTVSSSGNLSAVVQWAQKINDALESGNPPTSYNRMQADISNGSYSATKRSAQDRGVSPTGIYWCTNLVIDSYNLAGITGLNASHQGVRGMMDFWKKTPEYNFIPYTGLDSLKQAQPGSALFRIYDSNYEFDHVSIIKTISIDERGNGDIKTLDSNSQKGWTSVIREGKIVENYFSASIKGFGGIVKSSSNPTAKTVIVLDPGHSGSDIDSTDSTTGLRDHDYPNHPELEEVFNVAQQVKNKLESDGYSVIMTKSSANDNVSLRKRADIANTANAALAVSIHDDHGVSWDNFAQIYTQQVGLYRQTASGKKVTFDNSAIAQKSQQYGRIFAQERTAAEKRTASVADISFNGRDGLDPGNIPLVELFANVPWVYNEVGTDGSSPLSQAKLDAYAQGIINGIEKSIPLNQ